MKKNNILQNTCNKCEKVFVTYAKGYIISSMFSSVKIKILDMTFMDKIIVVSDIRYIIAKTINCPNVSALSLDTKE
jgi:hypothetical protein